MAATAAQDRPAHDSREETEAERLDRNTIEFVQEVRVAAVGIQVLFAFLLVVPFNTGWKSVSSFDRYVYFVTLLCIATASVLLIAPSIHHRVLFRRQAKEYIIQLGTGWWSSPPVSSRSVSRGSSCWSPTSSSAG